MDVVPASSVKKFADGDRVAEDEGAPAGVHEAYVIAEPTAAGVGEAVTPAIHDGVGAAEGLVKLHPPFTQTTGEGVTPFVHELKS